MALVRRMKEGAEAPTLYNMYDKQYDFNNLRRTADAGLSDYIMGLKRGKKDEAQFREAYRNLIAGIGDGSISFQDGRFVDARGRYFNYLNSPNQKDKNRDYYGLMANYIFGKMGQGSPYQEPEDTSRIKFTGADSIGLALRRSLYNSDSERINDFIDQDLLDPETKTRATTNRAVSLADKFKYVHDNWDTLFTEFTNTEKTQYQDMLRIAEANARNGIDPTDYLSFGNVASGLNYRNMFYTGEGYGVPASPTDGEGTYDEGTEPPNIKQLFRQYMDLYHPQHSFTAGNPLIANYDAALQLATPGMQTALNTYFQGKGDADLQELLRTYLRIPDSANKLKLKIGNTETDIDNIATAAVLLKYLKDNNKLSDYNFGEGNPGLYYLPGSWSNGSPSGLVWDTSTGQVSEMDYLRIPYIREKIMQEFQKWLQFQGQEGTDDIHWLDDYGFYMKRGGVIKANQGTSLKGPDPGDTQPMGNYFLDWVKKNYGVKADGSPYQPNELLPGWVAEASHTARDEDQIGNPTPTLDNAYQLYRWYVKSGNVITDVRTAYANWKKENPNGTNEDFITWYNGLVDNMRALSQQKFTKGYNDRSYRPLYDNHTKLYSSLAEKFSTDGSLGTQEDLSDILGPTMFFRNPLAFHSDNEDADLRLGTFTDDENSNQFWIDNEGHLEIRAKEAPKKDQVVVSEEGTSETSGTEVRPTTGDTDSSSKFSKFLSGAAGVMKEAAPDILAARRLAPSLSTNNKVARVIRPSLKSVLQDTYGLYSPVTGAFSEMQFGNRQASDLRRQGARAFTSDPYLAAATMLDANRQANDLQYQKFLANDREILRTQQEALKRQEDNTARKSQVTNADRASINATNREIAQLEATRLNRNWQSWDNYLQGVEDKFNTRRALRQNDAKEALAAAYQDAVSKLDAKYRLAHPNATASTMVDDPNYVSAVGALKRQLQYEIYSAQSGRTSNPYSDYTPKSYTDIIKGVTFSKKGGTLHPSAMYLINKVIKNESNT